MTQTSEYEAEFNHTAQRPIVVQFQGAPTNTPNAPKAPRGIVWVRLAEEGDYANHQVRVRTRYSEVLNSALATNDFEQHKAFIKQMVLEHNGWLDPDMDEPTPLPPVTTPCELSPADAEAQHVLGQPWCCFWHAISLDEMLMILAAWGTERKKLQVLPPAMKTDSPSG